MHVRYFLSYCCDKIPWQKQCRERRAHCSSQFQVIIHRCSEVTETRAPDNLSCFFHYEEADRTEERHGSAQLTFIQASILCLGNGSTLSEKLFPSPKQESRQPPQSYPLANRI